MGLQEILRLMRAAADMKTVIEKGIELLTGDDQVAAKEAYEELKAGNDAGHARVQAKLEAAGRA